MSENEVQFHATEPGDPMCFSDLPDWLIDAIANGLIERISGDNINGGDWDYIGIHVPDGTVLVAPDEWIIRDETTGTLHREETRND